ncbi:hypothetical protein BJX70DRAFT_102747 [Aspergillus crustosus]
MFCPCARSYLMVEGLQTERPRLVRSRLQQPQTSSSRAPLPMQIRPQSARDLQRRDEEAQTYAYGPVRSRPIYCSRGYGLPHGILKVPTEEFPFGYHTLRQQPAIQISRGARVEVGRSSSRSPSPSSEPPASDVVRIRVHRSGGITTSYRCKGVITEKVRLREGDIVVRSDTGASALTTDDVEPNRGWGLAEESSAW